MEHRPVETAARTVEGGLRAQPQDDLVIAHDNPALFGVEVQKALRDQPVQRGLRHAQIPRLLGIELASERPAQHFDLAAEGRAELVGGYLGSTHLRHIGRKPRRPEHVLDTPGGEADD